ncbi:DNA primase, partial [candidate division WOR-3 bacterium]|nr:DNA primase [candidate division WOR-3 bacterium]
MSSFYLNQEKIEEVRESADIVDIISEYIPIKKTGKNYTGLCPFHSEKKPSFTVSPIKQLYHCFGCGASGNVITFVMNYESVSFIEAIEILAKKYGITLKKKSAYSEDKKKQEIINANEFAFKHFKNNLFSESGKHALEYLKKREINLDTIEKFGLGYAPEGWDNLLRAAQKEGISNKILISAGLIVENEKGKLYDRFRKRIIFTFYNSIGKKIGFAGRNLGDEMPKYLNISESPLYKKRYTLYGLYQGKEEIRKVDKCIIVEGYMDLLTLYQAGFKNTAAISGTSLTDEQANLIRKYTRNIYISFDADRPGKEATLRGVSIFINSGLVPYIMTLPKGKDPDDIINKEGKDVFRKLIKKAEHFIDFKLRYLLLKHNINNSVEKAEVVKEMMRTISQVKDLTERRVWLNKVSRTLSVDESILITSRSRPRNKDQFTPSVLSSKEMSYDLVVLLAMIPDKYSEVVELFKKEKIFDETTKRILNY